MAATERITMTMRELDRFKVIQDVADGKLKPWLAAERLELTTRQLRSRRQRPPKVYQPRARRACLDELIHIDGSDHRWFENRAPACTLLVYVDDATSRLMMLHFTQTESTFSYFEATRAYIERHGKPGAFYSDKASVFRVSTPGKTGNRVTPFGRAMYELNIDTFCANSSSAKGRVERAHLTLQDRLVKEMRLRGINTVADANAYASSFMAAYNTRFAKPPKSDFNAHRPLRPDESLEVVLTWREPRKVTKSLTVQYDRVMYLLDDTPENRKLINRQIEVWEYPDGRIELRADDRVLRCRQYDRLAEIDQGAVVKHKRLSHVLQVAQALQAQRDNRRIGKAPSRTHRGDSTRTNRNEPEPGKKKQREITQADVEHVIVDLAQRRQTAKPADKPGRRSAKAEEASVSALPVQAPTFDTA
ncbi:ISNCY family transposase [Burkholderia multivorans]|uniref:ISNCY family transposase n=1 Tax=Burkholderia multivorans TaxID=87883 RepID=UPI000D3D895A|nr:ISNCY family transposase [Burkholderia multivorans]MBR8020190.1 ISNCY family transposase [Burkholderia multivorans]MEB2511598.1 ISNCY family transposase [Burkholderia multivorans]MEB2521198.1 ISNCY family transposase [Burkholderia multivorans]MEB2573377.1 ISNCY family transposase [Burkholderia multivorans]MEB2590537.1 ISNCY family transposase [Burkholderia multivorans]